MPRFATVATSRSVSSTPNRRMTPARTLRPRGTAWVGSLQHQAAALAIENGSSRAQPIRASAAMTAQTGPAPPGVLRTSPPQEYASRRIRRGT
ncbi:hypothetical protein E3O55_08855 [Cryobacterium sp. MDB1-18-2]|uniref:hypothetical protein n=1 Tax=unclassified Cryobacterium TaxID=2649013 RepID=UPI00106D3A1B|nr:MULTISPECIES: hypothetical protein [unclassified Cryobacterium]TFC30177.1 hypothetical protein E3O55_08855 [Cryobacterium sp. MDB1-18-2]TFC41457.1 hypothetical protein E3O50_10295 [Cryobacterium sp. MDB1-18-1]